MIVFCLVVIAYHVHSQIFSSMLSKTASSLSFSPDIMRGAHACAWATKDAQNKGTSLSCLAPSRPSATHVVIRDLKQGRRRGGSENNGKKMNLHSFKLSTFPGVEFLRILLRLKKMKGNSSKYVHVLHQGYVTRDDSQRRFLA